MTAASDRMMSALRQAHARLQEDGPDLLEAFRSQVAQALHERFACSLATLWCVEGEPGARRLVCVTSLSDRPGEDLAGAILREEDLGEYFAALLRDGIFNSPDALNDKRLDGLRKDYLQPNRVGALLDAAARVNGEPLGVICIEQRGCGRIWSKTDELDLRRATAQISLSLTRVKELARLNVA